MSNLATLATLGNGISQRFPACCRCCRRCHKFKGPLRRIAYDPGVRINNQGLCEISLRTFNISGNNWQRGNTLVFTGESRCHVDGLLPLILATDCEVQL